MNQFFIFRKKRIECWWACCFCFHYLYLFYYIQPNCFCICWCCFLKLCLVKWKFHFIQKLDFVFCSIVFFVNATGTICWSSSRVVLKCDIGYFSSSLSSLYTYIVHSCIIEVRVFRFWFMLLIFIDFLFLFICSYYFSESVVYY